MAPPCRPPCALRERTSTPSSPATIRRRVKDSEVPRSGTVHRPRSRQTLRFHFLVFRFDSTRRLRGGELCAAEDDDNDDDDAGTEDDDDDDDDDDEGAGTANGLRTFRVAQLSGQLSGQHHEHMERFDHQRQRPVHQLHQFRHRGRLRLPQGECFPICKKKN